MHFYLVSAILRPGATVANFEADLDGAVSWFRFARGQWVIYDNADAAVWDILLRAHVEPEGQLFICRLDIGQRSGWMTRDFWRWVRELE